MRHIGNLPDEQQARTFEDYMFAADVRVRIDPEDDEWAVWVIDEDELDEAREELVQFREDPTHQRYRKYSGTARKVRKEEEKANHKYRQNQIDVRTKWRRGGAGTQAGTVTKSLIVACVLVGLSTGLGKAPKIEGIYAWLLFTDIDLVRNPESATFGLEGILSGQIWRLVTPMLIHYGPIHLLFNMMWLHVLGSQIEARRGAFSYLILIFCLSAFSNFAQFAWGRFSDPRLSLFGGMSGVVYGLLGYIWMKSRFEPQEHYLLSRQTVNLMLIWLLLCMTGAVGPVANAAHLFGLLAGVGFGYWNTFRQQYLS